MHTEFLIVGQGISGTFLGWWLQRAGRSFMVIDNGDTRSASRVAAGVINPVTGRRIVKTWMIDILMPFALESYRQIGTELNIHVIDQKNLIDFFPSPQMLLAFKERVTEDGSFLSFPTDQDAHRPFFRYDFGVGEVSPAYMVHLQPLLNAWRRRLADEGKLIEEEFEWKDFRHSNGITYKYIVAEKIIFCDGMHAADIPVFKNLPFALNKGEALLIEAELPSGNIFKKGLNIVPLSDRLFWVGSSYEWNFDNAEPTALFEEKTMQLLRSWCAVPFKLLDHVASVRPATIERRPFVGVHPHHPGIAILNGMGTKGCTLAPYFAQQLADNLVHGATILPEANVNRFRRVLQ